jgi:tetratricopeptide (TPR) repeat protein
MKRIIQTAIILLMFLFVVLQGFVAHAAKKSSSSPETLLQYTEDLKKNPGDNILREKIIKMALGIKPTPKVPEDAERNMARGTAFAQKATDSVGYKRAIAEFEAAANTAPWLAHAYYNLGVVQEKAGLFVEAIQSLKFYLMAAPDAKNARDVKNKIYALEADAEDIVAGKNAPAPVPTPEHKTEKSLALAGKPTLEIEPEKPLKIIKMPQDMKSKMPNFIGNWYYKQTLRGEELTIPAFEIAKNANGDLVVNPPKRAADSVATVNIFEIADKKLKLQMKWKMKSVVGYWKTETYDLMISEDGSKLTGSHNQQSVGGRNIDMDRVLFRQLRD